MPHGGNRNYRTAPRHNSRRLEVSRWLSGQGGELALEQAALALVPAEPYGEFDLTPRVVEFPEAVEQLAAHARQQMRSRPPG